MTGESTSAVEQTNWPTLLQLGDLACAHAFMKARLAISSDGTEAARFAVNLLVRLNKRFDIFGPDATDIADQARAILPDALINANPQVTLPYAGLLRVGHGPLVASGWQRQLGSTGWCARLGTEENTGNPVAQMAVACLGVASLLRHFMGTDVPAEWTFSLLDYDRADSPITPVGQTIGATTLFGLGGLGSPFLYAVRALELRGGPLGLVDFDVVDDTNLQRYAFNVWADRGQAKVAVAAARLAGLPLIVQPYNQTFREYFEHGHQPQAGEVCISALDHRTKRRELQGYIPETIINASLGRENQITVTGLGWGQACLYCLYWPDDLDDVQDRAQAAALGLTLERLQAMRAADEPVTVDMCHRLAEVIGQPTASFDRYTGMPVDSLYRQLCADNQLAAQSTSGTPVWTALSFQAALGGVLLAAELVKHFQPDLAAYRLDNMFVWNTLALPQAGMRLRQTARPNCPICQRAAFLDEYQRRYGTAA